MPIRCPSTLPLFLAIATMTVCADDIDDWMRPAPNTNWNQYERAGEQTRQLTEHLYTYRCKGTRSIFVVDDSGVIATDPISAECAKRYLAAIRKVTEAPIRYLVYSHQHWDHILGGQAFRDAGAEIVAHQACEAHFQRRPHPDLALPDRYLNGNETLTVGEQTLELMYLGRNHGDCFLVMRPDARHLYVNDLVTPGVTPLSIMPDYDLTGYLDTLRKIEAMEFDAVIGGHGVPVAHRSALTERRRYLEALLTGVKKALDEGAYYTTIGDDIDLSEFRHMRNYERNLPDNIERAALHFAMGW